MTISTGGFLRGGTVSAMGWQKLGFAIVTESFRWAAFGMTGADTMASHHERITSAQHFLFQGTGLEALLDVFGIEMTGDETRGLFEAWLRRHHDPYTPHSSQHSL